MMIFAAVAYDEPQQRETVKIDESLFSRIGAGEKDAFCELYEQISNIVFSYALSLLRNREDAEDAMQETFLKIRSAAHLYVPMGKPMAWIFTITRNICLAKYRMMLKKLCEKGIFKNERAVVSAQISREEFYGKQSREFVEDTFGGSLPKFLTAFIGKKKLSDAQVEEMKALIENYRE